MSSPRLLVGRRSVPGAVYVVTTVVIGRRPVLADARKAQRVVDGLDEAECEGQVESIAWVVMPDHAHWMFELRGPCLSAPVARFKARAARRIHALAGGSGAFWQAGYYDHQVRDEAALSRHARYIVANPVRSGLCAGVGMYPFAWSRYPS